MCLKNVLLFTIVLSYSSGLFAQRQLVEYMPDQQIQELDRQQLLYLEEIKSWEGVIKFRFARIQFESLLGEALLISHNGRDYLFRKTDRKEHQDPLKKSWIGKQDFLETDVHLAWKNDLMVGLVELGEESLLIRPLGNGLHAIVEWDMTIDEGCQATPEARPDRPNAEVPIRPLNEDQQWREKQVSNRAVVGSSTGECNVRVLVAYTTAAKAALPDILLDINNLINIANTGYINSSNTGANINMSIELAAAFEVAYTESGDLQTDLDRLTLSTDGFMDIVHNYRNLWDADQCALIVTGGGGIGWISTAAADQFSITGINNFGVFTFHHELGHNGACTHAINQSSQPGSSPYAGYGDPSGCYRTVMAYQDACGTGSGTCPRQNIFSDNDANTWTCGGNTYTPGTIDNRNQDRLHLSGPILIDHRTVLQNAVYGSNYDWLDGESIHFAAGDSLTYQASVSTFQFELMSGSEGSFRAAYRVHLGRGFKAHAGSSFRAWIDRGCVPFEVAASFLEGVEGGASRADDQMEINKKDDSHPVLKVFPNPATTEFFVELILPEPQTVSIALADQTGKTVMTLASGTELPSGSHKIQVPAVTLPAGQYIVVVRGTNNLALQSLVVVVE